jgi:dTDP-glucose pyrophosphorylase
LIGLPDTIWFPENAYLPALVPGAAECNLVLFPVDDPAAFDAVICDDLGFVQEVQVKKADAASHWIWGAVTLPGEAFHQLKLLWESRHRADKYLGELLNAFIAAGNPVRGRFSGESYMDVGTLQGYRNAQDYLRANVWSRRVA